MITLRMGSAIFQSNAQTRMPDMTTPIDPRMIGQDMLVGAFDVHAVPGRSVQNPGRDEVDDEADGADRQHDFSLDVGHVREAVVGLENDPSGNQHRA